MLVPCRQNHGTKILFPMIVVYFSTKLSIYIIFYSIEKPNILEVKTIGNVCSFQHNKDPNLILVFSIVLFLRVNPHQSPKLRSNFYLF